MQREKMMDATAMPETSNKTNVLLITAHLFIVLVSGTIFFSTFQWNILFAYHPSLMSVAFVLCMSEGVLVSRYIKTKERQKYLQVHLCLQALSVVFSTLGFLAIYVNKNNKGSFHLVTWHAWCGAAVLIMQASLTTVGLMLHYRRKNIIYLGGHWLYRVIARTHSIAGGATHALACLTMALGFYSAYATVNFSENWRSAMVVMLLALAVLVQLMRPKKRSGAGNTRVVG